MLPCLSAWPRACANQNARHFQRPFQDQVVWRELQLELAGRLGLSQHFRVEREFFEEVTEELMAEQIPIVRVRDEQRGQILRRTKLPQRRERRTHQLSGRERVR